MYNSLLSNAAALLAPDDEPAAATSEQRARSSLLGFIQHTFPRYQTGRHHRIICGQLERVERGEIDRLILCVPPRHGKSEAASVRFPAWYLGRHPNRKVIITSYSAHLAYRFSRRARNLLASARWPFPDVQLAADSASVALWEVEGPESTADLRGACIAAGVGGPITGEGAHLLIIDDPIKNREEAESATIRESIWDWYTSTAYSRLEDGGAIVLILTRWHHDDLAGRLLKAAQDGGDQWEVVSLPAIDETGAPLWPEKYDLEALQRIKRAVGSRDWAALYQQQPTNDELSLFRREWWRYYRWRQAPECDLVIQMWDTAFKAAATSDYSVCATWGRFQHNYYLLDLWRAQVAFPDLKRQAVLQYDKWRPNGMFVEDAASGQSLIQELQRETDLPVVPVKVDRDKIARAHAVTAIVEAGRCYLPEGAPWLADFVEEHAQFPSGAHDDQVDTTTMALLRFQEYVPAAAATAAPPDIASLYGRRRSVWE